MWFLYKLVPALTPRKTNIAILQTAISQLENRALVEKTKNGLWMDKRCVDYGKIRRPPVLRPELKSCSWKRINFEKNRSSSLTLVKQARKVSMCHLKVIPIHFLEPPMGPQKLTNLQNR